MRVLQILLLLIIAVRVNSDGETFGDCTDDDDCPQNATCVEVGEGELECECEENFSPYDSPVAVEGVAMVLCIRRYLCMHVYYPCYLLQY